MELVTGNENQDLGYFCIPWVYLDASITKYEAHLHCQCTVFQL